MNYNYCECSVEMGSVTQAMRARNLLASAAIPCEITKSESGSRKGCAYSVCFSCTQSSNVRTILANAKVPVKRWHII